MIEELNLEVAKSAYQKSKAQYIVELVEQEIHVAVSLTKATGVLMPTDQARRYLDASSWDDVMWEAISEFERRGFTVTVQSGAVSFMDKELNFTASAGAVFTFGVSGWAEALGEHAKLKS
jgi:hypothetical protein